MSSNIFLSVRPKYADKIFKRTKTVELRRVRPKLLEKGDLVLLYVSSPIQALVGTFKVNKIIEKPLEELWQIVQKKAGITRREFDDYYNGVSTGVAIFFKVQDVQQLDEPIPLDILKEQAFYPPQGFRYCSPKDIVWFNEINIR